MENVKAKVVKAARWAVKKVAAHKGSLRMDVLLQFGFLALCLWIIVENSPEADAAFTTVLNSARNSITALFTNVGNL